MLRYDRSRYLATGIPNLLNTLLLPLYALEISTGGSHDEFAVPFYLAMSAVCAIFAISAMVKRCRDVGWSPWGLVLGLWLATPLMLIAALVLIFVPAKPSADRFEPPPLPPGFGIWFKGPILLLLPWIVVLFLRAL